jgi:hypothetical protein
MKTDTTPRNRDTGRGGHPTQFAPKTKAHSTLRAVDLLSADDISTSHESVGVSELTAYRDAVEAGTVVPPGFNSEIGSGDFFLKSLDKQIAYASLGKTESADALRFHNLRLGASEDFVVDGKAFTLELDHSGDAALIFETTISELESPNLAGMRDRDRETYEHECLEHIMNECGAKSVTSGHGTATVRVKARRPQFNSLPDCVNKISDAELDFFIAADSFRQNWMREHAKADDDDWLNESPSEQRFVG